MAATLSPCCSRQLVLDSADRLVCSGCNEPARRMLPGPVDPDRPYIGKFCFSETHQLTDAQIRRMARTGKLWLTEFEALAHDGRIARFGGTLIADGYLEALEEADRRDLGEEIIGTVQAIEH